MDNDAIRAELNKVRDEIRKLKSDFLSKKNVKEEQFTKGEEYSNQINALYEEVKKIESENNLDKINSDLELKKVEYEELKKKIDEVEIALKASYATDSSKVVVKKPEIKTISVEKAKKELKDLDLKLQTQVLSLEKESELIKKINEIKGFVNQYQGGSNSLTSAESTQTNNLKKEIRTLKKKFFNVEKSIRSIYKQIRLISKEKKLKYKQIDDLRELKKKSFEDFRENKKDYSGMSRDLKTLFKLENELMSKLGETPVQKKKVNEANFKVKQKELEDKLMKKGQVLTTEDLMFFQSGKK